MPMLLYGLDPVDAPCQLDDVRVASSATGSGRSKRAKPKVNADGIQVQLSTLDQQSWL
ncbi:hypothetical protein [Leptolyngbya sp. FACHB-1515]|uniref:hypothetical protein n=1 Tax=Leptolyngbya sp. FACHB-1515 TaxID=2933931 RepID=UPI00329901BA